MIDIIDKWGAAILLSALLISLALIGYLESKKEKDYFKARNEYLELEMIEMRQKYQLGFMHWQIEQVRIQEEKQKIKDSLYNVYYGK